VRNNLFYDGEKFFEDFESAFDRRPISKARNFLGFSAGQKGKKMLILFLSAEIENLFFKKFFELLFVWDINKFIKFLFVNGQACLFVTPLT
jgi:hypothetical protein